MNIFIGNLNYKVQSAELGRVFEQYGEVTSARVIIDRETGRSKGFGFVEMPQDEEATKAINELNGTQLAGREMIVSKANPKKQ